MGNKTAFILGTAFGTFITELVYSYGWIDRVLFIGFLSVIAIYSYILGMIVGENVKNSQIT